MLLWFFVHSVFVTLKLRCQQTLCTWVWISLLLPSRNFYPENEEQFGGRVIGGVFVIQVTYPCRYLQHIDYLKSLREGRKSWVKILFSWQVHSLFFAFPQLHFSQTTPTTLDLFMATSCCPFYHSFGICYFRKLTSIRFIQLE